MPWALAAVAMGVVIWLMGERPSLQIEVERGGNAVIRERWRRVALPETVHVRAVGSHTVIRIVNRDTLLHHLGLFDVGPGETRDFVMAYPGTFGGYCSAHNASRQLIYVVE